MTIKHKAQMSAADRALFQQHVEDCLLTIIATQKKPVVAPLADIERLSANHRLIISKYATQDGVTMIRFEAQKADVIEKPQGQRLGKN